MITKKEILRLAKERGACVDGLEWYSKRPKNALLSWEAVYKGYFGWVADNIPEARPYLQTLPEELQERALRDENEYFRASMAFIGHRLDVLKDDPDWFVRRTVARQGYALEQLKDDPDYEVRAEVALKGHALEQLKDDPDWFVRRAVARQGYALEKLKDDLVGRVREEAREKLREMQQ